MSVEFNLIKMIHVSCAILSFAGFFARGLLMTNGSVFLDHRLIKIAPHVVDSCLLMSAIAMLIMLGIWPWQYGWLLTKIVALVVYIVLGLIALRFGRNRRIRICAWLLGMLVFAFIVSTAITKSPLGILA